MNQVLRETLQLFWTCLAASGVLAGFAFFVSRRRDLWLRLLDAEESFWLRFGFRKGGFGRRFGESRFFVVSIVAFAGVYLLLAAAGAVMYFLLRHKMMNE